MTVILSLIFSHLFQESFWLHQNKLSGMIPSELGHMMDLYVFSLLQNSLEGPIPCF
jgi:hypothetical protein